MNSLGVQGNAGSDDPQIAALAGFVAFRSDATNLVPNDTNGLGDIFLRDLAAGTTRMLTHDFAGGPANGDSYAPFVNSDGLFVAYDSLATNLVPGDANGVEDCFLCDTTANVTTCISLDRTGAVGANGPSFDPTLSADGRFAAFYSDASNLIFGDGNGLTDVFVRDLVGGVTRRVSHALGGGDADGQSFNARISGSGRFVVYESGATNLVASDVNGRNDIFEFDLVTNTNTLVSVSTSGDQGDGSSFLPMVSGDGRYVTFLSNATNLVPDDTNGVADVFVHDMKLGVTHRLNLGPDFAQSNTAANNPAISGDGSFVAWMTSAADLDPTDSNGVDDVFSRHMFPAGSANYGAGWPGTLGVPSLTISDPPVIGTTEVLEIGSSSPIATQAVLFLGLQSAQLPTAYGGELLLLPRISVPHSLPAGGIGISVEVPELADLEGVIVFLQDLQLDLGASQGVSFTPGLRLEVGW
jgi:Tol biopolymer transport system component